MPEITTTLGPLSLRSFTFFLGLALAAAAAVAMLRLRPVASPGHVVDTLLGGLLGAVAGARLAHVLLNWDYFASHTSEIVRLTAGGLDWHGALLGGLLGLALVARWRRLAVWRVLDALSPALPMLALGGWYACWAAACGYGREVDTLANYPAYAVAELPDVFGLVAPRYNTQVFGIGLAFALLVVAVLLLGTNRLSGRRFWLVLALLGVGMFVVSFWRGDPALFAGGLRLDQWLDALVFAGGVAGCVLGGRPPEPALAASQTTT